MGKRSEFPRIERNYYPTPYEAVVPLFPHLSPYTEFDEPCCGDGRLIDHLQSEGHHCILGFDLEPQNDLPQGDLFDVFMCQGSQFITNPPWPAKHGRGEPTLSIIKHLSDLAPTWLLLSADFIHNKYFTQVSDRCRKVVSIGRVSWMGNGKAGVDNCIWILFDKTPGHTQFFGRTK